MWLSRWSADDGVYPGPLPPAHEDRDQEKKPRNAGEDGTDEEEGSRWPLEGAVVGLVVQREYDEGDQRVYSAQHTQHLSQLMRLHHLYNKFISNTSKSISQLSEEKKKKELLSPAVRISYLES